MPSIINFNAETLARLFRKLKRVNNFNWYILFDSRNRYTLIGESKTNGVKVLFTLNTMVVKQESIVKKRVWILNTEFLDYIQTVGLREAAETFLTIDIDTNKVTINGTQDLTELVTYFAHDLSLLDSTKHLTYDNSDVNLSVLPTILKTLATSPFDFVRLHIDTTSDEVRLVNDNYGMLSVIPITPIHTEDSDFWILDNMQDLHSLLSGFTIRVEEVKESPHLDLGFIEPTTCWYPVLDTSSGIITFEYEIKKNGKISIYDECCIQLPIYISPYSEITTALSNLGFGHKFSITPKFIDGCYTKAREATEEVIPFLSKPTEVRIGIRELAWLSRLTKKYGTLECKLTSNNVMQVVTPDFISYITLYSKRENNVSSPSN